MLSKPLPDLAASLAMRRQGAELRLRTDVAGQELASGRRSDLFEAAGRDPARLLGVERDLARAEADAQGFVLAGTRASAAQAALGRAAELTKTVGAELLAAVARGDAVSARAIASEAEGAFADFVDRMNTRSGDRALFAGAAVDGDALADAESMLIELRTVVGGAVDGAEAAARVDAWFEAPGGGFELRGWLGEGDAPVVRLGDGVEADVSVRADAPEIRDAMKGLALAAVAADPLTAMSEEIRMESFALAAERGVGAADGLVEVRSALGLSEARIEEAETAARARRTALEISWNDQVARDPFEAASEFQALETQMQTAYTVAARLSRLTFADFLR